MLLHLSIENYTLIKQLEIDFSDGFSVITGETGAGKSILLGALSLILGQRSDTNILFNKEKKCIIEGKFQAKNYGLQSFFENNDLDYDDEILLRREINKQGKSRGFINDTPTTLSVMKELGEKLINIHSQHTTLTLNKTGFQKGLIDSYSQFDSLLSGYKQNFNQYIKTKAKLNALIEEDKNSKIELDYLNFQFQELEEANLNSEEQEILEKDQQLLSNTEQIKSGLHESIYILSESDENIVDRLKEINNTLGKLSNVFEIAGVLSKRIQSAQIEISDISDELSFNQDKLNHDPEKLLFIEDRLNLIYTLQQKHNLSTVEELIGLRDTIDEKINTIGNIEVEIEKYSKLVLKEEKQLFKTAKELSKIRKKSATEIQKKLLFVLSRMGMGEASFVVSFIESEVLLNDGIDKIQFLFNANRGGELSDISQVASGGELSRLMLGLKSLIFKESLLPTIIFDEIDTGVSGDIAGRVGEIMKEMSAHMQVIAITHLPQIAGKSKHHYFVYKSIEDSKTSSKMKQLSGSERIDEIAKMLSSDSVSEAAKLAAKELLN